MKHEVWQDLPAPSRLKMVVHHGDAGAVLDYAQRVLEVPASQLRVVPA
jgi:hypothetical protein